MQIYKGQREGSAVFVTVVGIPLNPRLDLWDYSPNGFEWGYDGRGPAQLALALLADCLGDDMKALRFHQDFKRIVLVPLDYDHWTLTDEDIQTFCATNSLRITTETGRPTL